MLARISSVLPSVLRRNSAATTLPEFQSHIGSDAPPSDLPRLNALEALWGVGRYGPGSGELDDTILDALGFGPDAPSPIGLLGTDPVLALAARNRFGAQVQMAEWRRPCADRSFALVPDLPVTPCDLDRPHGFEHDSLTGLISQDAMAFADHKSGLATQVFRFLKAGGLWILFDVLRHKDSVPETAFGSAWAEPQLPSPEVLETLLQASGFKIIERLDVMPMLVRAVNNSFKHLSDVAQDMRRHHNSPEFTLMLQEIAWEAASWKVRLAAMQEQELSAVLWTIQKPACAAPESEPVASENAQDDTSETLA